MPCSAYRRNAIPAQNAAIAAEDFHSPTTMEIITIVVASPYCLLKGTKGLLKQMVCLVIFPGRSLSDKA